MGLLGVSAFGTMAALRVCDPLLPVLARDFGASIAHAGQTVSVFAVGYGLALLAYGALADRFGKLRMISIATGLCAMLTAACALAPSLYGLIGLRALAGAAAAGVTPLAMAWIGDSVPYERRQEVLARLIGATTLGMIAGQWLGGVLADTLGWRSAFAMLSALFVLTWAVMRVEWRGDVRSGVVTAPTSATPEVQHGFTEAVALVLRGHWARRILVFVFVEGVFVFIGLAFLPTYLHHRFGLPMRWAGAVLALYGIGGLLYSGIAPLLLRRFGQSGLARIGGSLLCTYFFLLAVLPQWSWALPACLVGGLGFYMLHNTLQTHATQMTPSTRGTAVALFSSTLFLGQSLGVAVGAVAFDGQSSVWAFIASALALAALGFWFAACISARERDAARIGVRCA